MEVSVDLDGGAGASQPATLDLSGDWTCAFGCTALGAKGTPYSISISRVPGSNGEYKVQRDRPAQAPFKVQQDGPHVKFITPATYPNATISRDFTTVISPQPASLEHHDS